MSTARSERSSPRLNGRQGTWKTDCITWSWLKGCQVVITHQMSPKYTFNVLKRSLSIPHTIVYCSFLTRDFPPLSGRLGNKTKTENCRHHPGPECGSSGCSNAEEDGNQWRGAADWWSTLPGLAQAPQHPLSPNGSRTWYYIFFTNTPKQQHWMRLSIRPLS